MAYDSSSHHHDRFPRGDHRSSGQREEFDQHQAHFITPVAYHEQYRGYGSRPLSELRMLPEHGEDDHQGGYVRAEHYPPANANGYPAAPRQHLPPYPPQHAYHHRPRKEQMQHYSRGVSAGHPASMGFPRFSEMLPGPNHASLPPPRPDLQVEDRQGEIMQTSGGAGAEAVRRQSPLDMCIRPRPRDVNANVGHYNSECHGKNINPSTSTNIAPTSDSIRSIRSSASDETSPISNKASSNGHTHDRELTPSTQSRHQDMLSDALLLASVASMARSEVQVKNKVSPSASSEQHDDTDTTTIHTTTTIDEKHELDNYVATADGKISYNSHASGTEKAEEQLEADMPSMPVATEENKDRDRDSDQVVDDQNNRKHHRINTPSPQDFPSSASTVTPVSIKSETVPLTTVLKSLPMEDEDEDGKGSNFILQPNLLKIDSTKAAVTVEHTVSSQTSAGADADAYDRVQQQGPVKISNSRDHSEHGIEQERCQSEAEEHDEQRQNAISASTSASTSGRHEHEHEHINRDTHSPPMHPPPYADAMRPKQSPRDDAPQRSPTSAYPGLSRRCHSYNEEDAAHLSPVVRYPIHHPHPLSAPQSVLEKNRHPEAPERFIPDPRRPHPSMPMDRDRDRDRDREHYLHQREMERAHYEEDRRYHHHHMRHHMHQYQHPHAPPGHFPREDQAQGGNFPPLHPYQKRRIMPRDMHPHHIRDHHHRERLYGHGPPLPQMHDEHGYYAAHPPPPPPPQPLKNQRGKTVLRRKCAWKNYPELENFLIEHREEYLRHSAMNYTAEQKLFNNDLTKKLLEVADKFDYEFDPADFNFVAIRDRIRCYYKSYVQNCKKRGIAVGYDSTGNKKRKLSMDGDLEFGNGEETEKEGEQKKAKVEVDESKEEHASGPSFVTKEKRESVTATTATKPRDQSGVKKEEES